MYVRRGRQILFALFFDVIIYVNVRLWYKYTFQMLRSSKEPVPPIPFFSSEKAQIVVEGIPITKQLQEYLHVTSAGQALCKYICKKASWTKDTFDKINWPALELYLQNLPGDRRMNVVKMQHRLIFTAERDHLFQSKTTSHDKKGQLCLAAPLNVTRSIINGTS